MGFNWHGNIRCTISDGNAFLSQADMNSMECQGHCSECDSFLGVNISMVGEKYLDGPCSSTANRPAIMRGV